jgi:hypothetical protein
MFTTSGQAQRHGGKGAVIGRPRVVLKPAYQAHPECFVRSAPKLPGVPHDNELHACDPHFT